MLLYNIGDEWNPVNAESVNPIELIYIGAIMKKRLNSFKIICPMLEC